MASFDASLRVRKVKTIVPRLSRGLSKTALFCRPSMRENQYEFRDRRRGSVVTDEYMTQEVCCACPLPSPRCLQYVTLRQNN